MIKVFMMSLEAMLCLSVKSVFQCFELKHLDSQNAYGFGCLADDTTDKMN